MEDELYVQQVGGLSQWRVRELDEVLSAVSARLSSVGVSTSNQQVRLKLDSSAQ